LKFRPAVADLVAWCERKTAPLHAIVDREDRERQQAIERQDAERTAREARAARPTLDELRAKHGPSWGLKIFDDKPLAMRRAGRDERATEREILTQYARRDRDPVYAGHGILVSPSLVDQLRPQAELGVGEEFHGRGNGEL
jgi:hypothetical protein